MNTPPAALKLAQAAAAVAQAHGASLAAALAVRAMEEAAYQDAVEQAEEAGSDQITALVPQTPYVCAIARAIAATEYADEAAAQYTRAIVGGVGGVELTHAATAVAQAHAAAAETAAALAHALNMQGERLARETEAAEDHAAATPEEEDEAAKDSAFFAKSARDTEAACEGASERLEATEKYATAAAAMYQIAKAKIEQARGSRAGGGRKK